jgi:hypothetical protein
LAESPREGAQQHDLEEMLALPKADPYDEIYRDMSSWYRLIDPALLDPGRPLSQPTR